MSEEFRIIGKSLPRFDGPVKVAGEVKFLEDIEIPGCWLGGVVRSEVPRGVVRKIETLPAFAETGAVLVKMCIRDSPNSVRVVVSGDDGRTMEAVGYSIGGGAVILHKLDGFQVDISCTLPAVIIMNRDVQGVVSAVTSYLSAHNVNIATMKLPRDTRGGLATMVIELDSAEEHADTEVIKNLHPGIVRVIGIEGED